MRDVGKWLISISLFLNRINNINYPERVHMKTAASNTRVRNTLFSLGYAAALFASPIASASGLDWTFTGPGALSSGASFNTTRFDYILSGPDVFEQQTWTASATAAEAGDYAFEWTYGGFHGFYKTNAFLNATDAVGTTSLLNFSPFDRFYQTGSHVFANVNAGDTLSLTFGGSNFDMDWRLIGDILLTQVTEVPEPASVTLFGVGLIGVLAARRQSKPFQFKKQKTMEASS